MVARTDMSQLLLRLTREQILAPFWHSPGAGFFRINETFLQECVPGTRLRCFL